MGRRHAGTRRFGPRHAVVVLTLLSHLAAAFGFPLPAPGREAADATLAFPCQDRPCGCSTAEQCWQGDCCCFTLEEKLAWAEWNGMEPPGHVRPLVESRRSRPAPPRQSCCAANEPLSASTCCVRHDDTAPGQAGDCPHCAPPASGCCDDGPAPGGPAGVRWVVGSFARKCRGDGPAGWCQLEPAVVADLAATSLAAPQRGGSVVPAPERAVATPHRPPTPPPRRP